MNEQISVTRASKDDDLSEIAALQAKTFTNPWSTDSIRWELTNTDVARLYILWDASVVVGYCLCWVLFDELHINSLAIDPELRRRGLATLLLRHVAKEAVSAGATKAMLEVRRSNVPAVALYERLGFRLEGVRKDYYEQPREDALLLWCRTLAEL